MKRGSIKERTEEKRNRQVAEHALPTRAGLELEIYVPLWAISY
jgi:hypothetical protein